MQPVDGIQRVPTDRGELGKLAHKAEEFLPSLARKPCPDLKPHESHEWNPEGKRWKTYFCRGLKINSGRRNVTP